MTLEEYKAVSHVFEEDIYEADRMEVCVDRRLTLGAPGRKAMEQVLCGYQKYLQEN